MNGRHKYPNRKLVRPKVPVLIFLSVVFLLGLGFGCILASFFQKESDAHLFSYLDGYFSVLESGRNTETSVFSTFWELCRWPLFAGLMAATLFGVVALPVLLFLRGLLLSYAASVLICLYGRWNGLFLSLSIFGIPALCSVVSLFMIGWNVISSRLEGRRAESRGGTGHPQRLLSGIFFISLWIAVGTVFHHWISPVLLSRVITSL